MENKILQVKNLVKHFPSGKQPVKAVDNISFNIYKGETLGLVGESGCGKSTTGRLTLRLIESTSGNILFKDKDILELSNAEMNKLRREMQIIFQDPFSSLDPRKTIGDTISRPLKVHKLLPKNERFERTLQLMDKVGLDPNWVNKFPHELDGGRRQRVGIARALALNPTYIVCDEPVSALDVSIQAQVLNLLQDLQEELGLTYLFISHDLSVVKHLSNRIAVMYLGKLVELSSSEELFKNPQHPYTKALLSAIPIPSIDTVVREKKRIILEGDVPSPKNPPSGCRFHTRCPYVMDKCKVDEPEFKQGETGHYVACHLIQTKV